MKLLKKLITWLAISFSLIVLIFVITAIRIWHYGTIDEKTKADAIIVLGAAAWHDFPSPVFQERINHGLWLYEHGYADTIIFTGGYGIGAPYSESYVARSFAMSQGVDFNHILIEEYSTSTDENFSYAIQLMNENGLQSAIVVSDPLHMLRAMSVIKDAGVTAYSSPTPTTRFVTLQTQLPFLVQEVFSYLGYQIQTFLRST